MAFLGVILFLEFRDAFAPPPPAEVQPNAAILPAPLTYTFTNIVDSSGPHDLFNFFQVNAAGSVAFTATPRGGGQSSIYTGDGHSINEVAHGDSSLYDPAINDSGVVAFAGRLSPGEMGVFRKSGTGPLETIFQSPGLTVPANSLSINSAGKVAFAATLQDGRECIFVGGNGPVEMIAENRGAYKHVQRPSINADGAVAFQAELAEGGSEICIARGGVTRWISRGVDGADYPAINAAGRVAFRGSSGIYTSDGGPLTTIAHTGKAYQGFEMLSDPRPNGNYFTGPGISNDGTVVFAASLGNEQCGLFHGPDAIRDRIIQTGDPLFGSTLISIQFSAVSSNGKVAFIYQLANELSGIAVATPVRGAAGTQPGSLAMQAGPGLPALSPQSAHRAEWYRRALVGTFLSENGGGAGVGSLYAAARMWCHAPDEDGVRRI